MVFSTADLGMAALQAFNDFGGGQFTQYVPAILMLGAKHGVLASKAYLNEYRAVVTSPFKMSEFKALVEKLVSAEPVAAKG